MTGRDLLSGSLRLIGALASGEILSADGATDGLNALNSLIDGLSNEGLLIYSETRETPITLIPGTATYTLGAGGSVTNRPMKIDSALLRDQSTTPAIEYPVRILSISEWSSIPSKDLQSTYPTDLYDDGGYPQRTITVYPVPSAANKLVLFTKDPLSQVALDTLISLPPGYERMLKYNLAMELAPEYGRPTPAEVVQIATESKAAIKRTNMRPSYLRIVDLPTGQRPFNIYKGDTNR